MKNKTKEYFYSEIEDKVIVDFVTNDFKTRQQERKPFELAWELNMNFYLGNQFSYISKNGELSDIEKNYYWENREVYNHIAPIIESRLAKLNKIKPTLCVKPFSNSNKDQYSAKLAKSILQNSLENNNIESLILSATYWSEITGTSFYKITWDSSLGNTIGKNDNNTIKNGDVQVSVCSPFEIYPDSNGFVEVSDCNSIIEARAVPIETINEIWNIKFDGEDIDIFELNNNSFISGFSGRSNTTKISHSTKHNHVLLIERYEKPSIKNPNGKLTIVCRDKLLYDGELPYSLSNDGKRTYPFIKQVSTKQIACFWGISVIERCIPIQRAYNAIKNKKHEFISRLTSGVLIVEDGSVDVDNLEDEGLAPGKILIYRNGAKEPKFLDPGNIPTELEKEEDRLISEINNLCCVSDITTSSSIPSNISSGSALSLLINQDESRLSLTAENIRLALKQIGIYIIRIYKQFATTPRLNKYTDEKGKLEVFYWNNSNLTSDDVYISSNNELEESSAEKKATILELYSKGLLADSNGNISQENKLKILTMLGFKNWDSFSDINEIHKEKADKENLDIVHLEEPLEVDNHELHISEHTKFLITSSSEEITKENKDKLLNHIRQHKSYLKD